MVELKNKIIALCNSSGLTIEQVVFVLKDVYRDAEEDLIAFKLKQEEEKRVKATETQVQKE